MQAMDWPPASKFTRPGGAEGDQGSLLQRNFRYQNETTMRQRPVALKSLFPILSGATTPAAVNRYPCSLAWRAAACFGLITVAVASQLGAEPASLNQPAPPLVFPREKSEWPRVAPEAVGWNAEKLQATLAYAGQTRASGVVILHRGRILAEQYWSPDERAPAGKKAREYGAMVRGRDAAGHAIEDVASVQKSVAAILVGMAQHRGLLRIDDVVSQHLGRGWSKASPEQEAAITIRHLLTMTSGLTDDLTFEAPAGTRWRYNSAAYSRTVKVVAAVAKKSPDAVTREWLTGPLGMADSHWVERAGAGREVAANPLGFATTARDLARLGLFVLGEGKWDGATVFADRDYLQAALHPSQSLNPSYGYLWWLNGQAEVARGAGERVKGPLIPTAPPDLVAALGAIDRKLYVVPSLGIVVTRLGNSSGPAFQNEFWKLLMAAAPRR